jgi:glycosyltransferase involved in cell wall biosynthesis
MVKILDKHEKIEVIPNAPDETYFYSSETSQNANRQDGNTILFVGSIGKRKGIFDLLNAIPIVIKDWEAARFIFLGEEEIAGEKERVLQICRQNNLREHVFFAGWVTGDEKRRFYQQADIFTLPSHAENLPYSLLEAMAVGLPVVTTPVGGIPELVEDGREGFLIQPGDDQELAERILYLLRNPQLREELGRNARWRIQKQYSPEKIAEQWAVLYGALSQGLKRNSQQMAGSTE